MADMNRDEVIALIVRKAKQHGIEPVEFLGGAIAESGLNPEAWRQGVYPDWSAGLFQQTVAFADEGDHTASPENVELIKRLYFDPEHACDVAAKKYKYWRYNPDVPALTAWVAYNGPTYYHTPNLSPNIGNYRAALAEAERIMATAATPPAAPKVTYDHALPAIAQSDDWSCAPTSTRWALRALQRNPSEAWIESQVIADGIVSREKGLLDATGNGLAAWVAAQYGEWGYAAEATAGVAFDYVAMIANGSRPVLIGGRTWNHWSAVRLYSPSRDVLLLANPADGWKGVRQEMSRQQFGELGPFSAVVISHPDLDVGAPPLPEPTRKSVLIGEIRTRLDELEALPS